MTYNEYAFDILELLNAHQISDDSDVTRKQVLMHLNVQRALWLSNEYNKPGRVLSENIVQDLGCLELEIVDASDCCVESGCTIVRTKKELPKFIDLNDGPAIKDLGPINKLSARWGKYNYEQALRGFENKYTSGDVYGVYMNKRIYLFTTDPKIHMLDYMNVRGVIENPEDMQDFVCDKEGTACFSYDDEYPMPAKYYATIRNYVLQKFGVSIMQPKDDTNNSKDNIDNE